VLTKSRRALAASALAVAVAGGSVAVIRAMSPSVSLVSPSAMPSLAGPAATAAVPRGAGSGQGTIGALAPAVEARTGGNGVAPLARSAGQGDPGPLPAEAVPADGAVPGASPAIQAQAAARAAITALPHSPRLLAELAATPGEGGAPSSAAAAFAKAAAAPDGATPTSPGAAGPTSPSPGSGTPTSPDTGTPTAPVSGTPTSPDTPTAPVSGTPTSPGTGTPTSPGTGTPTSPGTSTPTSPGTGTPTSPGTGAPTFPGTGAPTSTGTATPTSPVSSTAGTPTGSAPPSSPAAPVTSAPKPTPSATPTKAKPPRRLPGLDVAAFQHPGGAPIYWSTVARAGYKFAGVKGTEGDYYVNRWAASDLKSAKAAGLDAAPYHFAIPNASGGAAQAQFAVEYSGYTPGARTLPLMLDIEYDPYVSSDRTNVCYGLTATRMTAWLAAFVTEARTLTGQYPVIYTTADWWNTCTGRSAKFGADPMWIAAYGFATPPMPAGWKAWTLWQYTSAGKVPGVAATGTTDLDTFSPTMVGLIDPGNQATRTGTRVSLAVASLGAVAGEALTYAAAGLPPGLSIGKGGTITGTVTAAPAAKAAVTYRVTVSVRNAAGTTATATFSWKVSPA
jgi:GH25 family lysozyme M1 (1,4-beta-N-acetylmuramidase)